ncbi:MAG TPA: phosphotransferase [Bacteroidales bacterium]|nr:phosphotransferase [Bacteroidales bacterium]
MEIINIVKGCYTEFSGKSDIGIIALPQSGSDRRYFRIMDGDMSFIGAYNANHEENEAFIGFTKHFLRKQLPVPDIHAYFPEKSVYFLRDLGDINLYTWLHKRPDISDFNSSTKILYRKVLDNLIRFQVNGIEGLDLDLCYPHRSFDRQSMMWDLNYFKYMFLKLLAVPFNEKQLEKDFNVFCDFLLETSQEYFLYRDFQTANIMVVEDEPWFIDYQGGRKGAPQYDVASLLYDAKIPMADDDREELLTYYIENFCSVTGEDKKKFRQYYTGFSMIRVMQALGAFGFRGLYEKKPTFIESIVPGVVLLSKISLLAETNPDVPELYKTIRSIKDTAIFKKLSEEHNRQ